jgi:hypothetical protein
MFFLYVKGTSITRLELIRLSGMIRASHEGTGTHMSKSHFSRDRAEAIKFFWCPIFLHRAVF